MRIIGADVHTADIYTYEQKILIDITCVGLASAHPNYNVTYEIIYSRLGLLGACDMHL